MKSKLKLLTDKKVTTTQCFQFSFIISIPDNSVKNPPP